MISRWNLWIAFNEWFETKTVRRFGKIEKGDFCDKKSPFSVLALKQLMHDCREAKSNNHRECADYGH